jgi:hypothetical protein
MKSALWVRFLSPPSYKDTKLQLYPHRLEPHKGPGQGKDFSLLSALALQYPSALTLRDIGITERTRAATTVALLQTLPACPHPPVVPADKARVSAIDRILTTVQGHKKWNDDVLLSEHLLRADSAPFESPCLSPLFDAPDSDDDTGPFGYSRFTLDPSHRGEAMHHVLQPEWIKVENLESDARSGNAFCDRLFSLMIRSLGLVSTIRSSVREANLKN